MAKMALPHMSESFIKCRETGRRNKRIVELTLGWRYAGLTGDRQKMLEIEDKIRTLRRHMAEEGR
jgi:hypothetical protein